MPLVDSKPAAAQSDMALTKAVLPSASNPGSEQFNTASLQRLNMPRTSASEAFKPFTNQDFQLFLDLEYGQTVWRYWDSVPQDIKANFSNAEGNPIWTHSYFLSQLEKKFSEISDPAEQEKLFTQLATQTFGKENLDSVSQYLPAVQTQVARLKEFCSQRDSYQERFINNLALTRPGLTIENNFPLSRKEEISDFAERYPTQLTGHGVYMGEYAVAHSKKGEQIVATDYLMDCVSVVLTSQNPSEPSNRYALLAHIDATTDLKRAVAKLLSEIPEDHKLTAYVLGSPRNENVFLNTSVIGELANDPRLERLAINTNGPTTVAVHAVSGTVLTLNDPNKSEADAYSITNLPLDLKFPERPNNDYRGMNWYQLNMKTPPRDFRPTSTMVRVYHPYSESERHPGPSSFLEKAEGLGYMSTEQMLRLAEEVKEQLGTDQVRLQVERENGEPFALRAYLSQNNLTGKAVDVQLGYCSKIKFEQDSVEL